MFPQCPVHGEAGARETRDDRPSIGGRCWRAGTSVEWDVPDTHLLWHDVRGTSVFGITKGLWA